MSSGEAARTLAWGRAGVGRSPCERGQERTWSCGWSLWSEAPGWIPPGSRLELYLTQSQLEFYLTRQQRHLERTRGKVTHRENAVQCGKESLESQPLELGWRGAASAPLSPASS